MAMKQPAHLEHLGWNYVVLAISAACEGYSLRIAYLEFRKVSGEDDDLWPAIRLSKDPGIFAVLFEDSAALIGLGIAFLGLTISRLTGMAVFDGIASICIGFALVVASTLLANETVIFSSAREHETPPSNASANLFRKAPAFELPSSFDYRKVLLRPCCFAGNYRF